MVFKFPRTSIINGNVVPNFFVEKIIRCPHVVVYEDFVDYEWHQQVKPKRHVLSRDPLRKWEPGMCIHFSTNTPLNDKLSFAEGICKSVQDVELTIEDGSLSMVIDGRKLNPDELHKFAENNGFDSLQELLNSFESRIMYCIREEGTGLKMRLIHWTKIRY